MKLADNQDSQKSQIKFKTGPHCTSVFGVTCPILRRTVRKGIKNHRIVLKTIFIQSERLDTLSQPLRETDW